MLPGSLKDTDSWTPMSGPRYFTPASSSLRFNASNVSGVTVIATGCMPPGPSGTGSLHTPAKAMTASMLPAPLPTRKCDVPWVVERAGEAAAGGLDSLYVGDH